VNEGVGFRWWGEWAYFEKYNRFIDELTWTDGR
jgi:hypothetical protein